ncbi:MAG: hypothetical protein NT139_00975 [Candidatus Woesearchaeota archaeon]|nr:hypothetical protein [Candidatus Woesearchaeota archaeon]
MTKYENDNYEEDEDVEDIYDKEAMQEAVDDDEISEQEEGFLQGYQESIKKKKKTKQ